MVPRALGASTYPAPMHVVDYTLFGLYLCGMLAIGARFFRGSASEEDYFLGGRTMNPTHIGLSVVATDVGGGFSIGLGGLGFAIGIAGSWMLFSGLVGAWLSAVLLIPRLHPLSRRLRFLTFPDLIRHAYGSTAALLAGLISAAGYLGFTASQLLAGAKLSTAVFPSVSLPTSLAVMGVIVVAYTVLGGLKAVVFTDTIQWIILLGGLSLVGIPAAYLAIGGWEGIVAVLPPAHFSLWSIDLVTFVNWMITIVPIWFVAMTLYQRIYACRSGADAQRAWYVAGLFEWPIMAFLGVGLGLMARVAAAQGRFAALGFATPDAMDPEMGLPLLLSTSLPIGVAGILLAAYFSAIMSTADSCLLAASGNTTSDLLAKLGLLPRKTEHASRLVTLILGLVAILLASQMTSVLDVMLSSYAFMISGLLVPVAFAFRAKRATPYAAVLSMLVGGSTTLLLQTNPPAPLLALGLDANAYGLVMSLLVFVAIDRRKIPPHPRP